MNSSNRDYGRGFERGYQRALNDLQSGGSPRRRSSRKSAKPNGFVFATVFILAVILFFTVGGYVWFVVNLPAAGMYLVRDWISQGIGVAPNWAPWAVAALGAAMAAAAVWLFRRSGARFAEAMGAIRATGDRSDLKFLISSSALYVGLVMMLAVGMYATLTGLAHGRGVAVPTDYGFVVVSVAVWAPFVLHFFDRAVERHEGRKERGERKSRRFYSLRQSALFFSIATVIILVVFYLLSIQRMVLSISATVSNIIVGSVADDVPGPAHHFVFTTVGVSLSVLIAYGWIRLSQVAYRSHVRAFWVRVLTSGTLIAFVTVVSVFLATVFLGDYVILILGTALAATAAGFTWKFWTKKWKGKGYSPSPLVGVRNPRPRPGQMWWANHQGVDKSKIRPVMIVGVKGRGRDRQITAVIMTSGDYARRNQGNGQYLKIHNQSAVFRGFPPLWTKADKYDDTGFIDTALTVGSVDSLSGYIAKGPRSVYEDVCGIYNVEPMPGAAVFDDVNYVRYRTSGPSGGKKAKRAKSPNRSTANDAQVVERPAIASSETPVHEPLTTPTVAVENPLVKFASLADVLTDVTVVPHPHGVRISGVGRVVSMDNTVGLPSETFRLVVKMDGELVVARMMAMDIASIEKAILAMNAGLLVEFSMAGMKYDRHSVQRVDSLTLLD